MQIPENLRDRHALYRNKIRQIDMASRTSRRSKWRRMRSWLLLGSDSGSPVRHNAIEKLVNISTAHLFAPERVRFGVILPPHYGDAFIEEEDGARLELQRLWNDTDTGIRFDGVNDLVDFGNPANGALNLGTGDFTLELWMRTAVNNSQSVLAKQGSSGAYWQLLVTNAAGQVGKLRASFSDGSTLRQGFSSVRVDDNVWHYVVGTYDGAFGSQGTFLANLNGTAASPIIVRQYPGERATVRLASGEERVHIGVDGCGVPVHGMPLRAMATAFARLRTGPAAGGARGSIFPS